MELVYGAEKSASPEKNLSAIEGFADRLEVLDYDQMIVGHARSTGLVLVINNLREFHRVPGLRVEDWL